MPKNAFYAQSGGVTAVINASAAGVLATARQYPDKIATVYAGNNGILGAIHEELIDTKEFSDAEITALTHTPAGAFGSCRYKLKGIADNQAEYQRILEVFKAHDIGYFFYNGGGDSQDTTDKLAQYCAQQGYPLTCIGIPKTIDNDLPFTDCSPGFGSVAKYVAIAIKEAGLDVASMAATSTKVFILEVMGRHAGWIAAAGGLAAANAADAPHIILLPEVAFDQNKFLAKVQTCVEQYGFCAIVASEGVHTADGKFLADSGLKDAFGHAQLGGVAPVLASMIKQELGLKYHWAVADYLQRAARHISSQTDVDQAFALGKAAVEFALAGENAIMPIVQRQSSTPYNWDIGKVPLAEVANVEKKMPAEYISADGFGITQLCKEYLQPLIQGEAYPPYKDGLPQYIQLNKKLISKKLSGFSN